MGALPIGYTRVSTDGQDLTASLFTGSCHPCEARRSRTVWWWMSTWSPSLPLSSAPVSGRLAAVALSPVDNGHRVMRGWCEKPPGRCRGHWPQPGATCCHAVDVGGFGSVSRGVL